MSGMVSVGLKRVTLPASVIGVSLKVSAKALRETREMERRQAEAAIKAGRIYFD